MRDPIFISLLIVALIGVSSHAFQPEEGYQQALGRWLYDPVCEVPPDHDFGVEYYGLIYRGNTSNLIDQRVLCFGAWEKHILSFLESAAGLFTEPVFVDVGANTGLHSLFMSRLAIVEAFEPYPPVIKKLRENVERNGLAIRIHEVGLGAKNERLPFAEPEVSNQGTGSFIGGTGPQLEIVAGDEYFRSHRIDKVDLLKVDVEGFEKPVLLGLKETLIASRPVIVMEIRIEKRSEHLFQSRADLEAALPPDYTLLSFAGWDARTGSYQLGPLEVDFSSQGWQWDIIAVPSEHKDTLPVMGKPIW